jgi:hypothetical protein
LKLPALGRLTTHIHIRDEYKAVKETLCEKSEGGKYNHKDCIYRNYGVCGTKKLQEKLQPHIEGKGNNLISWQKWDTVKSINQRTKKEISKRQEVTKSGTVHEFLDEMFKELEYFSIHLFEAKWQIEQFAQLSKKCHDNY